MDSNPVNTAKLLNDLVMRVDLLQREVSRLIQSRSPDRFVPLKEATQHLHCGRDWLVSQIKAGVLRTRLILMTGRLRTHRVNVTW